MHGVSAKPLHPSEAFISTLFSSALSSAVQVITTVMSTRTDDEDKLMDQGLLAASQGCVDSGKETGKCHKETHANMAPAAEAKYARSPSHQEPLFTFRYSEAAPPASQQDCAQQRILSGYQAFEARFQLCHHRLEALSPATPGQEQSFEGPVLTWLKGMCKQPGEEGHADKPATAPGQSKGRAALRA